MTVTQAKAPLCWPAGESPAHTLGWFMRQAGRRCRSTARVREGIDARSCTRPEPTPPRSPCSRCATTWTWRSCSVTSWSDRAVGIDEGISGIGRRPRRALQDLQRLRAPYRDVPTPPRWSGVVAKAYVRRPDRLRGRAFDAGAAPGWRAGCRERRQDQGADVREPGAGTHRRPRPNISDPLLQTRWRGALRRAASAPAGRACGDDDRTLILRHEPSLPAPASAGVRASTSGWDELLGLMGEGRRGSELHRRSPSTRRSGGNRARRRRNLEPPFLLAPRGRSSRKRTRTCLPCRSPRPRVGNGHGAPV